MKKRSPQKQKKRLKNLSEKKRIENSKKSKAVKLYPTSRARKIISIVLCVLFILSATLFVAIVHAAKWVTSTYDETTFEQIIFNIVMPLDGVDSTLVTSAVKQIGIPALIALLVSSLVYIPLSIIFGFGITFYQKKKVVNPENGATVAIKTPKFVLRDRWYFRIVRIVCWIIIFLILWNGLKYADKNFGLFEYLRGQFNQSSFIENHYKDPSKTNLTFPEEKRNLIYIFMESTESSFFSKEDGGDFNEGVMKELSEMMKDSENTHFSNTDRLGGAVSTVGATWTMGGMFAQTSGLPLKLPLDYNNMMAVSDTFLSYTDCLGDVLEDAGYNQAIIMGSNGVFGGRTNYYTIHGNQRVYDWYTADDDGIRDSDYVKNYWGLYDKDLYAYAKKVLSDMSSSDEPFALTLLTVDTHFSNGYPCEDCADFKKDENGNYVLSQSGFPIPTKFEYFNKQYSNVYACASKQVYDFVEWLKTQEYYEDTTIIISGDHLTMDAQYSAKLNPGYVRTPVNLFINSAVKAEKTQNRLFSTMDIFPTTLAAMGVKIDGDRLGLGTNLFSDKQTLIEQYGLEYFEAEIGKKSDFYNRMLFAK